MITGVIQSMEREWDMWHLYLEEIMGHFQDNREACEEIGQ